MRARAWIGLAVILTIVTVSIILFGWIAVGAIAGICFIITALDYGGEFL